MRSVKIGPRYVSKRLNFLNADVEKAALEDALASAPGVMRRGHTEQHYKGGHRVSLELERDLLDQFIIHMDSKGWTDGF
ncbi:hypothetical protein C8239_14795 [Paracidovorax avenae]|uniref:hypothetical protein n=1 Tax=Paracidovorax avenae TaxID=80867 RepID=UPI000D21E4F8|nr:hypothetical protein [Paracidovorax avenae]AVS85861.1 hypothetical protein C8239_14795 [Paracidovorax avenae]